MPLMPPHTLLEGQCALSQSPLTRDRRLWMCKAQSASQVRVNAIWIEVIGAIIRHQGAVAATSQKHDQQKT